MTLSLRSAKRLPAALALVAVAAAAACTDRGPADPGGGGQQAPVQPAPNPGTPLPLLALDCTVTLASRSLSCGDVDPNRDGGAARAIMYGGQNQFVTLSSSSFEYDSVAGVASFNVRVRNLIPQPIGTTDATTQALDPSGIRVFFHDGPTVTAGTGVVSVANASGVADFTGTGQPFFQYNTVLDQYEQSAPLTWMLSIPKTVQTASFKLYVQSPVPYPDGFVQFQDPSYSFRRTHPRTVAGKVVDAYGRPVQGAVIAWSTSDATIATVAADSGFVTGLLPGTITLTATSTNNVDGDPTAEVQTSSVQVTITGATMTWTAGASSTDWNDGANWDRGTSPVAQDSVIVPVVGSGIYPSLVENENVQRLELGSGASVTINAFNLTAGADVISSPVGTTGGIFGTSGRLFMTGTAKNVSGRLPAIRVSGTYTLTANVDARTPLRVELGRLRNTSFRLRGLPN